MIYLFNPSLISHMTSPYVSGYFLRDSGTFSFNDYINICNGAFVYILLAGFLTLSQGNLDLEALLGGSLSVTYADGGKLCT